MEILYYFKEKDTLMDKWPRYHIYDELSRHGCNITVYNPLSYGTANEANERLIEIISKNKYDLFMTPHGSKDIYIETLSQIKQKGIPTLLICYDNLIVPFIHYDIAKHFDLVWLTSRETREMFEHWGANTIVLPYAANPNNFKPDYKDEILRVAFIGTPYGSRVNMINILLKNEVNVSLFSGSPVKSGMKREKGRIKNYIGPVYDLMRFSIGRRVLLGALKQKLMGNEELIYSNDFLKQHPPVEIKYISSLYSNYALSLASTAARNTGVLKHPVNIVNLRSFEIPMSGGLQICSYFDELAEYFEEDKEIIFYRSETEFVEKAKYYLRSDMKDARMKMKMAARKRAEREHTWFRRFKAIFDTLGIGE